MTEKYEYLENLSSVLTSCFVRKRIFRKSDFVDEKCILKRLFIQKYSTYIYGMFSKFTRMHVELNILECHVAL